MGTAGMAHLARWGWRTGHSAWRLVWQGARRGDSAGEKQLTRGCGRERGRRAARREVADKCGRGDSEVRARAVPGRGG